MTAVIRDCCYIAIPSEILSKPTKLKMILFQMPA